MANKDQKKKTGNTNKPKLTLKEKQERKSPQGRGQAGQVARRQVAPINVEEGCASEKTGRRSCPHFWPNGWVGQACEAALRPLPRHPAERAAPGGAFAGDTVRHR